MKKEDLISHCRYYKGETECPFEQNGCNNSQRFWSYEKWWVDSYTERLDYLNECVARFVNDGLGLFEETDNTPVSLKAILYNRFDHWLQSGPEYFMEWYMTDYKKCDNYGKSGV